MKRLKTLVGLLAKSSLVQSASVNIVHNYRYCKWGQNYLFEAIEGSKQGYLQGFGGNVQRGDHLILNNGLETTRYQVDEIEHYPDPANSWTALLCPCSGALGESQLGMGSDESHREPDLN